MLGSYANWDIGEPNCMHNAELSHPGCPEAYDEDCVYMKDSLWRTAACNEAYQALCANGKVNYLNPATLRNINFKKVNNLVK